MKDISFTAVVTAAHAWLNSEVLPGTAQAAPSVQSVVVAETTSPALPAKLWL